MTDIILSMVSSDITKQEFLDTYGRTKQLNYWDGHSMTTMELGDRNGGTTIFTHKKIHRIDYEYQNWDLPDQFTKYKYLLSVPGIDLTKINIDGEFIAVCLEIGGNEWGFSMANEWNWKGSFVKPFYHSVFLVVYSIDQPKVSLPYNKRCHESWKPSQTYLTNGLKTDEFRQMDGIMVQHIISEKYQQETIIEPL